MVFVGSAAAEVPTIQVGVVARRRTTYWALQGDIGVVQFFQNNQQRLAGPDPDKSASEQIKYVRAILNFLCFVGAALPTGNFI
jgi:hypothetical protein